MNSLVCRYYGIHPYSVEEETNLSDEEKLIRQCKINIVDACSNMRGMIDQLERRAKGAPENGDFDLQEHANLVKNWRIKVRQANAAVDEAATYGIV